MVRSGCFCERSPLERVWVRLSREERVPTKRIFDLVVLGSVGAHMVIATLVKPWSRYRLAKSTTPGAQVASEIIARAA